MTKDVILGSRERTYATQRQLVSELGEGNYTLPGALEAAVCILMEHVVSGNKVFGIDPLLTYTRCSEVVQELSPVVVGGFGSNGLNLTCDSPANLSYCGVGALRKFTLPI